MTPTFPFLFWISFCNSRTSSPFQSFWFFFEVCEKVIHAVLSSRACKRWNCCEHGSSEIFPVKSMECWDLNWRGELSSHPCSLWSVSVAERGRRPWPPSGRSRTWQSWMEMKVSRPLKGRIWQTHYVHTPEAPSPQH